MESIVMIQGDVNYPITLDPGVWIFDERKVDLNTYFHEDKKGTEDTYTKEISEHWDRERTEGAKAPVQTNDNKVKYDKQALFTKSYGISLHPFLQNAKPVEEASAVEIHTAGGKTVTISMEEAETGIIGFSQQGKPLNDGPVHFYFGDGSNETDPIRNIVRFIVK